MVTDDAAQILEEHAPNSTDRRNTLPLAESTSGQTVSGPLQIETHGSRLLQSVLSEMPKIVAVKGSSGKGAAKVIDGSSETCWKSGEGTSQHLIVSFEGESKFNEIEIVFQGGFASRVGVEIGAAVLIHFDRSSESRRFLVMSRSH